VNELSQGKEDQYPIEDILTVFNNRGWLIRMVLQNLPKQVAYWALDKGLVPSS